jgi:hypothetical protein
MKKKSRFTDTAVKTLMPPTDTTAEFFDSDVVGLALRVTPTGTKSWCLLYRFASKNRRMTLGRYPALTVKNARTLAREALSVLANGVDPARAKKRREREQVQVYDTTFGSLSRRFMREYERGIAHDDNPDSENQFIKRGRRPNRYLTTMCCPRGT